MNNTDAIHSRLPASVRFVALMDAGFFIDYPAYELDIHKESRYRDPCNSMIQLIEQP